MEPTTQSPDSDTITNGVRVRASAQFDAAESDPDRCAYLYAYRITISNQSDRTIKLRRRHWIILDANGERDDVRGSGVVGEYPELAPGESFEYESRCPLSTRWGTMEGAYTFTDESGSEFTARIGRFFLVPSSSVASN